MEFTRAAVRTGTPQTFMPTARSLSANGRNFTLSTFDATLTNKGTLSGTCRLKKTGKRDEIFLATKFGFVLGEPLPDGRRICGDPEYASKALERSLARLGVDHVDLWYLHRYVSVGTIISPLSLATSVPIRLCQSRSVSMISCQQVTHIEPPSAYCRCHGRTSQVWVFLRIIQVRAGMLIFDHAGPVK